MYECEDCQGRDLLCSVCILRLRVLRYEGVVLLTPGLAEDFDRTDQCGISADGNFKSR
jgi:hypothetical protein